MTRLNITHLQALCLHLNKETGSPLEYFNDGKVSVGHFYVENCCSEYQLVRTLNDGGGVETISGLGTARDTREVILAILRGIEIGKGLRHV